MATNLTVNNNVYAYPEPGDEPGWGADATGWAEEVTTVLTSLQGADDIPETTFNIANNQSSLATVTGLDFNPATVRSAVIDYSIYRTTNSTELAEKGTLELVYKNGGTVTEKWSIGRVFFGDDAGVEFSMTDAGQMEYTSTNVSGTGYVGEMKFEARCTLQ